MKKIVNKLRFMLLLGFVAIGVTAWSQAVPYINKMSITTQMFLDEMAGRISFDEAQAPTRLTAPGGKVLPKLGRPIVSPDTIDGRVYIASFIRVNDKSVIGELEALGVEIQCEFKNGTLVTANLPIDAIEQVAALEGVKKINVSSMMRPLTNNARSTTNVDDVLTLSNDARNAGLLQTYDGSGVVLGIIDNGIDYQHKAFTDKDGNSRIVGAYCYTGSSLTADWTGSGTLPTTDAQDDHGTHTSSIAGGSSVKVSGTTVTVTDDHSQATYGGMAPGADLFLAGVDLSATYCMNAFQRMANYADAVGKPLVVSNSWGSGFISNDGTTDVEDALSDYFGDSHPNHICLFAAGNEAGRAAYGSVNGGFWVGGTSTEANPLGTIIRTRYDYENYGYYYYGTLANCWTRATDADGIGINIYVINKTSGALQASYSFKSTDAGISTGEESNTVNVSTYFGSDIALYFDYTEGKGKHQALLYSGALQRGSSYALAIEVYPIGGSDSNVDIWGGDLSYFASNVSTSGHTWTAGSDDNCATGESINENVISVGSYVSRSGSGTNSLGDISDFSSYSLSGTGPTGIQQPWITAPGDIVISALNHYVSSNDHGTVTVSNSTAPYGEMSGTSMATPAAAGIVALWMQAAQEVGKDLTLSEVKNIMAQTAIKDSWVTSGANASHFGNGKIDALAGVQYILENYGSDDPMIRTSSTALAFSAEPNGTDAQQATITGLHLTDDITATLSDPSNVFSMSVARSNGQTATLASGDVLTVTYSPRAVGTHTGSITLTSDGAEAVTIALNGTAAVKTEFTICDGTDQNGYLPIYGYYYDNKQVNQMIYPADSLEDLQGKTLKSMTFYSPNIYFSGGKYTVKIGTTDQSTYPSTKSSIVRLTPTNITTVSADQVAVAGGTTLTINFDENNPFTYEGGNLLVDFEVTTLGSYGNNQTYFYGVNQSTYTGFNSHGSSTASVNSNGIYNSGTYGGARMFLPKVTIVAEGGSTTPVVETPVILPADGSEFSTAPQEVTITCGTSGATIYYSIDGGNTYQEYTGAFNVSGNVTVMAYAAASDMDDSATASATYTFKPATPVITPATGDLVAGQQVTISCATSGATIYYSTDGGNTYQVYSGAFTMSESGTVTAYAAVAGWTDSETASATYTVQYPSLAVSPSQVSIEDATGDARTSATVTVTHSNLTGSLTTGASTNWSAALLRDQAGMTLTYNGKALHQVGNATVSSTADGLTETVDADYLYTGPIYILGNTSSWTASDGIAMTRDAATGLYTATLTAQNSGDGYAYIGFTKRLGSNSSDWNSIAAYRFGPVSNDQNWALVNQWADNRGNYCDLDTVGGYSTIQMPAGSYVITINSMDNTFMIREAALSSSVSPEQGALDYGQVSIGASSSRTITITNDGDVPFTPSVSGLGGSFSTSYVPTELAPGQSATITITFTPTSTDSESRTVTVGDGVNSYSWTLNGAGVEGGSEGDDTGSVTTIRLRSSNVVTVPVYKTEMEVYAPYTKSQVDAVDVDRSLTAGVTNASSVQIDSKRPSAINGYNLYHHAATASNTVNDDNWAVQSQEVSFSIHDKVSSAYLPYNLQGSDFVQTPITLFPTSTASNIVNDIWVNHIDYVTVQDQDTYYVPVVVANGKVTQDNTYGSPIEESPLGSVELTISHSEGKTVTTGDGSFMWMTAGGTIVGYAPGLVEDGHRYQGYRYRVWRIVKDAYGTVTQTVMMLDSVTDATMVSFGSNQFVQNADGTYSADENSFLMPVGGSVEYIGRFYYVRIDDSVPALRAAEEVEGLIESSSEYLYYVVEATGSDTFTSVNEFEPGKEVVGVTYVNPLGMTSSQPFEGVNIIVTRYSDGTISTAKVLK